jgi:hypothetical protein
VNRSSRFVGALGLAALLAGCATTIRMYDGPARPETELALLRPSSEYEKGVLSSSYAEGGGVGLSTKVLSTWPRVYLIEIDGEGVPGAGNKPVEIPAGRHRLKVRAIAAGGTNEVVEIEVEVKGGISYSVAVYTVEGYWTVQARPRARWKRG